MNIKTGRNSLDVVMELVNLHFDKVLKTGEEVTEEEIERIYIKYYQIVRKHH